MVFKSKFSLFSSSKESTGGSGSKPTKDPPSPSENSSSPSSSPLSSPSPVNASLAPSTFFCSNPTPQSSSLASNDLQYNDLILTLSVNPIVCFYLSKVMDTAEIDRFAKSLLEISSLTNCTTFLIYGLLKEEFKTIQANAILRGNSLATKLESAFCRSVGKSYIKELFGRIVLRIVTDNDLDLSATDPERIDGPKANSIAEENRKRLLDLAQEIIDRITGEEMVNKIPREIRYVASLVDDLAKTHHPERRFPLLGGFILLRILNPVLASPDAFEILPDGVFLSKRQRANLVAITRVIQKLSNQLEDKDIQQWNSGFISNNFEKISQYLNQLPTDPHSQIFEKSPFEDLLVVAPNIQDVILPKKTLEFCHSLLYSYGLNLVKALAEVKQRCKSPLLIALLSSCFLTCLLGGKAILSEFMKISVTLGPPLFGKITKPYEDRGFILILASTKKDLF